MRKRYRWHVNVLQSRGEDVLRCPRLHSNCSCKQHSKRCAYHAHHYGSWISYATGLCVFRWVLCKLCHPAEPDNLAKIGGISITLSCRYVGGRENPVTMHSVPVADNAFVLQLIQHCTCGLCTRVAG